MSGITQSPRKGDCGQVSEENIKELNGEIIPPISWIAIRSRRQLAHILGTDEEEKEECSINYYHKHDAYSYTEVDFSG